MGNFTLEGFDRNSHAKFVLFVLLSVCQLNFARGDVLEGSYPGSIFSVFRSSEKISTERRDF